MSLCSICACGTTCVMQVYKCVRQGVQDVAVKIVYASSSGDVTQLQDFKRVSLLTPATSFGRPARATLLPAMECKAEGTACAESKCVPEVRLLQCRLAELVTLKVWFGNATGAMLLELPCRRPAS